MPTITVTEQSFEQDITNASTPLLIDFWAEWCGPCKAIGPILEELSSERENELVVAKVDVDKNQSVAAQFNIRAMPTLILYHHGKELDRHVGTISKSRLDEWVTTTLETTAT